MGQIKVYSGLMKARKILEESESLGSDIVSISRQIHAKAKQFIALKQMAADAEDTAVFEARMEAAITTARESLGTVTANERLLVGAIFNGIFPK